MNLEELQIAYASLSKRYSDLIAQEEVVGGTGSILMVPLLYDSGGQLLASFCSRSLKTVYGWGGYAIVGEPLQEIRTIEMGRRLIDGFGGWVGPVSVEFKMDARDGLPYLLEVNTRINGYNYLACAAGVNFAELLVRASLGERVVPVSNYSTGQIIVRTIRASTFPREELERRLLISFPDAGEAGSESPAVRPKALYPVE